jgi:hypothetical protein
MNNPDDYKTAQQSHFTLYSTEIMLIVINELKTKKSPSLVKERGRLLE